MPAQPYTVKPTIVSALQYTGTGQSANECVEFGAPDVTYVDGVLTAPSSQGPYVMQADDWLLKFTPEAPVLAQTQAQFTGYWMRYTGPPVGETQPA